MRVKMLAVVLGSFLFLGLTSSAFAHGRFGFGFIAPATYAAPGGYWECVNYDSWSGSCVQSVWVQNTYVQPEPVFFGGFVGGWHHHHHWR